MNPQCIYLVAEYGKIVLISKELKTIHNPALLAMVENDVILIKNRDVMIQLFRYPGVQGRMIGFNFVKTYICEGKMYDVYLPSIVPQLTKNVFVYCIRDFFILFNEHRQIITYPTLDEMIYNDLEQGINQHGEVCLFTKNHVKIKDFLDDDCMTQKLPLKDYEFEGQTICVQLPPIKPKISTPVDMFDIFS